MRRLVIFGVVSAALVGCVVLGLTATVRSAAEAAVVEGRPPLAKLIAGNFMRAMLCRMELNITVEQKAEMKKIRESHKAEVADVAKKVIEAKRALADEVLAEQPDEAKIRAAATKLSEAIGDAAVLMSKIVPEGRKVLTPEQQEKIKATRASCLKAEEDFLKEIAAK